MSHSSEKFPSKDTHQWDDDEDCSERGTSLMHAGSDKSQQHQPFLVLNENHPQESYQSSNHPQQLQTPVIVTSSRGYPPEDDFSLNHQSCCPPQISEKDENCYQPQQFLPFKDPNPINSDPPPPGREELGKTYPENIAPPQPETFHTNVSIPKPEMPPENVDSIETSKNVGIRRTNKPPPPPPSSSSCCCIS